MSEAKRYKRHEANYPGQEYVRADEAEARIRELEAMRQEALEMGDRAVDILAEKYERRLAAADRLADAVEELAMAAASVVPSDHEVHGAAYEAREALTAYREAGDE